MFNLGYQMIQSSHVLGVGTRPQTRPGVRRVGTQHLFRALQASCHQQMPVTWLGFCTLDSSFHSHDSPVWLVILSSSDSWVRELRPRMVQQLSQAPTSDQSKLRGLNPELWTRIHCCSDNTSMLSVVPCRPQERLKVF